MSMRFLPVAIVLCAALTCCGSSDMASMPIQGKDYSLTLVREKPNLWSSGWDIAVVVSHMPDCMRRHHLKHADDSAFAMEVFHAAGDGWILHQDKRWYVADTANCELQQFDDPPAVPGELVGTFKENGGSLQFVAAPK